MRRLVHEFLIRHTGTAVVAVICMLVVAGTTVGQTKLIQQVLDRVFIEKESYAALYLVAGAAFAIAVVKGVASYIQTVLMTTIGQRVVADIQIRLFDKLVDADLAFFHRTPSGSLISRFTNDANMLRNSATLILTGLGRDLFSVIGLVAYMFYTDWVLASVAFVFFPCAILPVRRVSRRMRRVSISFQEEMGRFNTHLSQVFQGARHVKAYGMEAYESSRTVGIIENIYTLVQRQSRVRAISSPFMEALGGIAIAAVIVYGGEQVMSGARTPGDFLSFIAALMIAYAPFKTLAGLQVSLQEGLASAQRIFEVLDIQPAIRDAPDARPLAVAGGTIAFEDVHFAYGPKTTALHGLTLTVPAGLKVALVGPSGAGKSTILNLIPRFYDVNSGRVTIDGTDVRDATLASLRGAIGLVSQEVSLFDDTVRANIAYGMATADEAAIVAAAQNAAAHDFILGLPNGYDTLVGEHGIRLSGGQRQRLSIARAMLKNAPILLLDEATSSLDTESERAVQDALGRLMVGRTSVVIAHRLSTIIDADLIYVIDGGQVVETGTHHALMQRDGSYARLWAMQFREGETLPVDPPDQTRRTGT